MTLLEIVCRKGIKHNEKIRELQEFLNKNIEIPIDKELFKSALFTKDAVDIKKEMVYLILQHCIAHDSARSKEGEILSFQDVMKILDKAVHQFVTFEYFNGLINLQDQSGNTLLHQAVISNNTEAIKALLKYGANSLMEGRNEHTPLDLAQGDIKKVLIECMKDQAQLKKERARCNGLIGIIPGIIPGVFLGVGLGVGSALVPSMTIILCTLAVSALVAGIAIGVAIYLLSQDYKQARSIEEAVNPQLSSVEHEKTADNPSCGLEISEKARKIG